MPHITKITLNPEAYPTDEHYPFNLQIFRDDVSVSLEAPITFFIGENGSGKSTLLEALARKCTVHIWQGLERTRYQPNRYEQLLYQYLAVDWTNGKVPGAFFASQAFRNFSRLLDEWASADPGILEYFGGRSLVTQSHGQSIMSYFQSRFHIKGIYFLDEPETALSPKRQIELVGLLQDKSQNHPVQFVVATHSPILMACPGAKLYSFDTKTIQPIDYLETEHYNIYKDFLNQYPQKPDG